MRLLNKHMQAELAQSEKGPAGFDGTFQKRKRKDICISQGAEVEIKRGSFHTRV